MDAMRKFYRFTLLSALFCAAPAGWARGQAAVPDETGRAAAPSSTSPSSSPSPSASAPLAPYGPVLNPRRPATAAGPASPATVRDETDDGSRQPPQVPSAASSTPSTSAKNRPARPQAVRRHPAWQVAEPLPRVLDTSRPPPSAAAPPAPQPVVPSSAIVGGCQGGLCSDAAGTTINNAINSPAGVGVSGNGRLCVRGTATVQCF
jgi:hypothetical protein